VNLLLIVLLWQGVKEAQRQGGALTIKHTTARKGKGPPGGGKAGPPGSDLERKVVNCLCCGKVYDFRLAGAGQLTNDLLRFLGESHQQSLHIIFCCHISMVLWQVTTQLCHMHTECATDAACVFSGDLQQHAWPRDL